MCIHLSPPSRVCGGVCFACLLDYVHDARLINQKGFVGGGGFRKGDPCEQQAILYKSDVVSATTYVDIIIGI